MIRLKQTTTDVKTKRDRTVVNDRNFQPWRVSLKVIPSPFGGEHRADYFVRAKTPDVAVLMAHKLWQVWEFPSYEDKGLFKADIEGQAIAEALDESEFMDEWRIVRKFENIKSTDQSENPMAFACMDETYRHSRTQDGVSEVDYYVE